MKERDVIWVRAIITEVLENFRETKEQRFVIAVMDAGPTGWVLREQDFIPDTTMQKIYAGICSLSCAQDTLRIAALGEYGMCTRCGGRMFNELYCRYCDCCTVPTQGGQNARAA